MARRMQGGRYNGLLLAPTLLTDARVSGVGKSLAEVGHAIAAWNGPAQEQLKDRGCPGRSRLAAANMAPLPVSS